MIDMQSLLPGESVGYARTFNAHSGMRIGAVARGYADGYPRVAPTVTPVAVDGILTRTVGGVFMEMLAVDLTPCPSATIRSQVELWDSKSRSMM